MVVSTLSILELNNENFSTLPEEYLDNIDCLGTISGLFKQNYKIWYVIGGILCHIEKNKKYKEYGYNSMLDMFTSDPIFSHAKPVTHYNYLKAFKRAKSIGLTPEEVVNNDIGYNKVLAAPSSFDVLNKETLIEEFKTNNIEQLENKSELEKNKVSSEFKINDESITIIPNSLEYEIEPSPSEPQVTVLPPQPSGSTNQNKLPYDGPKVKEIRFALVEDDYNTVNHQLLKLADFIMNSKFMDRFTPEQIDQSLTVQSFSSKNDGFDNKTKNQILMIFLLDYLEMHGLYN